MSESVNIIEYLDAMTKVIVWFITIITLPIAIKTFFKFLSDYIDDLKKNAYIYESQVESQKILRQTTAQ